MAIAPWERLARETPKAWHAFCHYRDLGPTRSVDRAWREHKQMCDKLPQPDDEQGTKRWSIWSAGWGWVERCRAWDAEVDRAVREKLIKAQLEARERHARLMQGALTALSVPVRVTLDAIGKPGVMQALVDRAATDPGALADLLGLLTRATQAMPGLITQERLALGLTSENIQVDDVRESGFSASIVGDPAATELAIRLLDRLAGASPGAPVGAGLLGVAGDVADGPAPELADIEIGQSGATPP